MERLNPVRSTSTGFKLTNSGENFKELSLYCDVVKNVPWLRYICSKRQHRKGECLCCCCAWTLCFPVMCFCTPWQEDCQLMPDQTFSAALKLLSDGNPKVTFQAGFKTIDGSQASQVQKTSELRRGQSIDLEHFEGTGVMEPANRMKFCERDSDWFTLLFEINITDSFSNNQPVPEDPFIAQVNVFVVTEEDIQRHVSEGRGPGLVSADLQSDFSLRSNDPVSTVVDKIRNSREGYSVNSLRVWYCVRRGSILVLESFLDPPTQMHYKLSNLYNQEIVPVNPTDGIPDGTNTIEMTFFAQNIDTTVSVLPVDTSTILLFFRVVGNDGMTYGGTASFSPSDACQKIFDYVDTKEWAESYSLFLEETEMRVAQIGHTPNLESAGIVSGSVIVVYLFSDGGPPARAAIERRLEEMYRNQISHTPDGNSEDTRPPN